MSEELNMNNWNEVTVRMPSRMAAAPQEIMEFLREHFAEDRILHFLWAIGDSAVHEAAEELRQNSASKSQAAEWDHDSEKMERAEEWSEAADEIDPAKGGGHYPAKLLCFRHGSIGNVQALPCPGTPWCGPAKWKEGA